MTDVLKSILCIVPLPPPITGAALASEMVVENLKRQGHAVTVIRYERGNLLSGPFSLKQAIRILFVAGQICFLRLSGRNVHRVYLVISSTFWGNIRDILILMTLGQNLRKRTVLHLHGSNLDRYLATTHPLIRRVFSAYLSDISSAIVLGDTLRCIFAKYMPDTKISVVPNCYADELLIERPVLENKFRSPEMVKVLYVSNLIKTKGYDILTDAFLSLPREVSARAELNLAGTFSSKSDRLAFERKIRRHTNITYRGVVQGREKVALFHESHVFCLPSHYRFEGQPISIIEAYAAGCIVLTIENGGIADIFEDGKTGFFLTKMLDSDPEHLRAAIATHLMGIITNPTSFRHIARYNVAKAYSEFSSVAFFSRMTKLLANTRA